MKRRKDSTKNLKMRSKLYREELIDWEKLFLMKESRKGKTLLGSTGGLFRHLKGHSWFRNRRIRSLLV